MVFHRARRKIDHKDIILNNYILQVHFTKKFGVIIDDKLKWANHISYIKNKIAKGMGILLNARKVLKIKVLLQLYHSFVYPYLIYCSEVWGNASDIHPHQGSYIPGNESFLYTHANALKAGRLVVP